MYVIIPNLCNYYIYSTKTTKTELTDVKVNFKCFLILNSKYKYLVLKPREFSTNID